MYFGRLNSPASLKKGVKVNCLSYYSSCILDEANVLHRKGISSNILLERQGMSVGGP